LSIVCLSALIYAAPSFAQWTCNPDCTTPTQLWPNNSANAKVGVGTNNPLAIFHAHMGTNSNLEFFNSVLGFGYAGALIDSLDDTGNNLNPLVFNATRYVFANGNVGIGIYSPAYTLHIYNSQTNAPQSVGVQAANGGSNSFGDGNFIGDKTATSIRSYGSGFNTFQHVYGLSLANMSEIWADQMVAESNAGLLIGTGSRSTGTFPPIIFATQSTERMRIRGEGWLDMKGTTRVTAQAVPASGSGLELDYVPGGNTGTTRAYNRDASAYTLLSLNDAVTVTGGASGKVGIGPGDSKVQIATTGRDRVKVDATRGPIQVGDLLVTSDVAGTAMKSAPLDLGGVSIHRPGTIIGKALQPLASGTGEILVLLSLQ
jgi:hypothetical protein